MKQTHQESFLPVSQPAHGSHPHRHRSGVLCGLLLTLLFVPGVTGASEPIKFTDLEKGNFAKLRWQNLKEEERTAFYRAYLPAKEMLGRVRLGSIDPQPLQECISGEAPSIAVAKKKFPLHYPMLGRMQKIAGVFEWTDKKLIFRTATQRYHVDEYHLLYRLEQVGFTNKSKPRTATVDAVWMVNRINALRIIYIQTIALSVTEK